MIETYNNALSKETCDYLIDIFETNKTEKVESVDGVEIFDQFELTWDYEITKSLVSVVKKITTLYFKKYDPHNIISGITPLEKYEAFRIKRYPTNKGRFPLHIDSATHMNCPRFLNFLFYLNDSDGATSFKMYNGDVDVSPTAGSLCVFPPYWMFPHEGKVSTTGYKYIMNTYLHWNQHESLYKVV
jgi:hypothetical protein